VTAGRTTTGGGLSHCGRSCGVHPDSSLVPSSTSLRFPGAIDKDQMAPLAFIFMNTVAVLQVPA
jgi:hypothetical protein